MGLEVMKAMVERELEKAPETVNLQDEAYLRKVAEKMPDVVRVGECAGGGKVVRVCERRLSNPVSRGGRGRRRGLLQRKDGQDWVGWCSCLCHA